MMIYKYELKILEKHLDTFGHVNNAVYLELYEEARWDYLTENGYGLDHVMKTGIAPVVLNLFIVYKREIKNREIIKVETVYKGMKNRLVMLLEQKMYNGAGKLVSRIDLDMGIISLSDRKLMVPDEGWKKALGEEESSQELSHQ